MERVDVWLLPSEEVAFNAEARKFNEEFLPLLDTDKYLGLSSTFTAGRTLSFLHGLSDVVHLILWLW